MALLDVGCGTGAHLELYRRYECDLYGIDRSPSMLEQARERLKDGANLQCGDASAMPFGDGSFDLVLAMLALHEMRPSQRSSVIREMKRVLKNNGCILLIDYHPSPVLPFKGLPARVFILLAEASAGCEHFRNYRQFIALKGLAPLIADHGLVVKRQRIVGDGALALYLLGAD
jgi:ubiquinone/menaquinone biosynthesis C-methylase UbiE